MKQVLIARAVDQVYSTINGQAPARLEINSEMTDKINRAAAIRVQEIMGTLGDLTKNPAAIAQETFKELPHLSAEVDSFDDPRAALKSVSQR